MAIMFRKLGEPRWREVDEDRDETRIRELGEGRGAREGRGDEGVDHHE